MIKKLLFILLSFFSIASYGQGIFYADAGTNNLTVDMASLLRMSCVVNEYGMNECVLTNTAIPFSYISSKPTTRSGYGITDAYPLSGNPSNFLTTITSGQINSALGFTPVSQSGARTAISLTTTGSGAASYDNTTGVFNVPTGVSYTAGTGIGISSGTINNTAPDQTVSLSAGRGISVTGTYPNFTIALVAPTITIRNTANSNARAVNSNFTINASKEANVTYTVTCSVTNPLLIGTSVASAYLEYSTDSGTTWQNPAQNGNSSGVGLTVTVQLTNGQTGTLVGMIPANALTRIRTATSGTGSITYVTGQETVY